MTELSYTLMLYKVEISNKLFNFPGDGHWTGCTVYRNKSTH